MRNHFAPGTTIQTHKHTGPVFAFTQTGRWHYLEYPNDVNVAGSYLYEPAGSVHTLHVPEDNDGDTDVWFTIHGANLNLGADGNVELVIDADVDFPDGVDETWPVRPDGHRYVDTKVANEQVVLQAHAAGEVAATVVRPADVYGPGSIPWTIWPVMGMGDGTFVLPSEGGVFSPVFVDDLVEGIVLAAGPAGSGQVITIGDGVGRPNEDFFGRYAAMLGIDLPVAPAQEVRAILDGAGIGAETVDYLLRRGTYSIEKARRVLGFEPAVDLDEGMARTERWLREQGVLLG